MFPLRYANMETCFDCGIYEAYYEGVIYKISRKLEIYIYDAIYQFIIWILSIIIHKILDT
jgi:hypothetical protein